MAGMGGRRCLEEMLRIDPHAKVLIMTGYADASLVKEALNAGAKGVLYKPFRPREITSLIRDILTAESRSTRTTAERGRPRRLKVLVSK